MAGIQAPTSAYTDTWLQAQATRLQQAPAAAELWCIFDNTASGAAAANALALQRIVHR